MPQVKVWNDNIHDFKQTFKGEEIAVPARGFIEMDYEEAIDFKGAFSPTAPHDYAGDVTTFFKMIRVENPPPGSIVRDEGLVNHATGQRASSPAELAETLAAVRHLLVVDKDAEKAAAPSGDVEAMRAELAELKAFVKDQLGEKRGPGRPRKEA